MSDLEIRSADLEYREDSGEGYLEGIAVPWGQTVTIYRPDGSSFQEAFERGSVEPDGTVWLYDGHRTPIGEIVSSETRDEGFFIRAKFALSDLAKNVYELVKNGAVRGLSVGFTAQEHRDDNGVVVRTLTRLREVSVTPRPAYSGASVLSVREESKDHQVPNHKEESAMTDSENQDLVEVREEIAEIGRRLDMLPTAAPTEEPVDTRSAAEVLKAIAKGDAETIERYEDIATRAYTGGTTADAPMKNTWVGDLTRIFDNSSGVLSQLFSTGALPKEGNTLEYAELASNTVKFEKQANEGDDLAYGKVTLTTKTAPVETFGGYIQLSRQAIERSNLPVLNRSLEALAVAAGARKKVVLRDAFNSVVTARRAVASDAGVVVLGSTLAASDAGRWEDVLIDAALKYDLENASPEALVVSVDVFKKLRSLTVAGERAFIVGERNSSGTLNLPGLTGNLAGLPVYLDAGASAGTAVFINGRGIRQYDSGIVQLQDENIINLSKDFSAYRYGAIAAEVPQFIVPVKFGA